MSLTNGISSAYDFRCLSCRIGQTKLKETGCNTAFHTTTAADTDYKEDSDAVEPDVRAGPIVALSGSDQDNLLTMACITLSFFYIAL